MRIIYLIPILVISPVWSKCDNWRLEDGKLVYVRNGCIKEMGDLECEGYGKIVDEVINLISCSESKLELWSKSHEKVICNLSREVRRKARECDLDDFVVILKTGKDLIFKRLYLQNATFGHKFKNQVIVSDEERSLGDSKVHNMYRRELYIEAKNRLKSTSAIPAMVNEDGWRRDAYKFLPGVRLAYEIYPRGKWYAILDDDTFLFIENLLDFFSRLKYSDSEVIAWIGGPVYNCGHNDNPSHTSLFYYGGCGIFISSGSMSKLSPNIDKCMLKYFDCRGGDVIISRCLVEESAISIGKSRNPHGFHFLQYRGDSTWPDKRFVCTCPVSAHHLVDWEMQELYEIENMIRNDNKVVNFGNLFTHLMASKSSKIEIAGMTVFNFSSRYTWNSASYKNSNVSDWLNCAKLCIEDHRCLSYTWENNLCYFKSELGSLIDSSNHIRSTMGVVISRYSCMSDKCHFDES